MKIEGCRRMADSPLRLRIFFRWDGTALEQYKINRWQHA
jgi:hypothetical protein